ncbi:MAG: TRAP transporter substrate-binding protein DctP [Myxococcota bacterium]
MNIRYSLVLGLASAALMAVSPTPALAKKKVRIKLGTLAPKDSSWLKSIERMGRRWKEASNGSVQLKVYPGGVAGDEGDVIRKMRIGQLHAATLTGIGLGSIDRSTIAFQIPMMFRSYAEVDYVRERIGPKVAKSLEDKGFVVLAFGDGGWVHFFSKKPALVPAELQKQKLYVVTGDPQADAAWRTSGFEIVPTSATDVLQGLQTGRLDAFATVPLYALAGQWFGMVEHMTKIYWAPLSGATVVYRDAWEKIDPELRETLTQIAVEETEASRAEIRGLGDKALKAMTDRGLKIHEPTPEQRQLWVDAARKAYPLIRGKVVPEAYFAEIESLLAEFRAKQEK